MGGKDEHVLDVSTAPAKVWSDQVESVERGSVEGKETQKWNTSFISKVALKVAVKVGVKVAAKVAVIWFLASFAIQASQHFLLNSGRTYSVPISPGHVINSSTSQSTSNVGFTDHGAPQAQVEFFWPEQDVLNTYDSAQTLLDATTRLIVQRVSEEKAEIRTRAERARKSESEWHRKGGRLAVALDRQNRLTLTTDRWFTIKNRGTGHSLGMRCLYENCIVRPISEEDTMASKSLWRFLEFKDGHYILENKETRFKLDGASPWFLATNPQTIGSKSSLLWYVTLVEEKFYKMVNVNTSENLCESSLGGVWANRRECKVEHDEWELLDVD